MEQDPPIVSNHSYQPPPPPPPPQPYHQPPPPPPPTQTIPRTPQNDVHRAPEFIIPWIDPEEERATMRNHIRSIFIEPPSPGTQSRSPPRDRQAATSTRPSDFQQSSSRQVVNPTVNPTTPIPAPPDLNYDIILTDYPRQ